MTKQFIISLLNKVNTLYTCYYEEAASNTKFPYCVIPTMTFSPLDSGYLCMFDIEIYNNELSNVTVEDMMDNLRKELDGYSETTGDFGYHIGYENQLIIKSNEQDLVARRVSFSARIFN